ncbi:MAG: hypothetical protein JW733_07490 [Coriobacteriia bacterium]|nr:hypothetical protein [Coriobacteriia bacterium]MBN2839846.1 hypothetical protein [Coriobacteriia bacterium]
MSCPVSDACELHQQLRSSVIKRVRYPNVLSLCESSTGEGCALYGHLAAGRTLPRNLLPDGSTGEWADDSQSVARRYLIIEDSQVFATLTASALRTRSTGAIVDVRPSFAEAESDLGSTQYTAVICGYGLGGEHTVHDVRRVTRAPIVVLTGRPDEIALPSGSRKVMKASGPDALIAAVRELTA